MENRSWIPRDQAEDRQCRDVNAPPDAVTHHLQFCMAATTITWIYGAHLHQAPPRRYATAKRTEYAFADLRRALAKDLGGQGFGSDCQIPGNATRNPLIATVMDLVA